MGRDEQAKNDDLAEGLDLIFDEKALIPAIIQEESTGQVLMMAYMNRESLKKTQKTGTTWFYSRSRQQLWNKGETSGHTQEVCSIHYDCDGDTLLLQVRQTGKACHTGEKTCFYRQLGKAENRSNHYPILKTLESIIKERRVHPREGSYTNYLFDSGLDKMLKKVGEEASEVIIASKNENKEELIGEISDLVYHMMVLMEEKQVTLGEIAEQLRNRHGE